MTLHEIAFFLYFIILAALDGATLKFPKSQDKSV